MIASLETLTALCFPVTEQLNTMVADASAHFALSLIEHPSYGDDPEVLMTGVKLISAILLQVSHFENLSLLLSLLLLFAL